MTVGIIALMVKGKKMSDKEMQEYVRKCPYFGNPNTIDSQSSCDLELHYRKICPSEKCICAEKLGLKGK